VRVYERCDVYRGCTLYDRRWAEYSCVEAWEL
jgi:hypothetical protein